MSPSLTPEIRALLGPAGPSPLVLVLIGNYWRGDDGIGPYVAARLSGRLRSGCAIVEAGERPEDALERVAPLKPGRVVILDAADFGGAAGEARVIPADRIPHAVLSTHRFPPGAIAELIAADTGVTVSFIGVQVKNTGLGAALSEEVRRTGDALVDLLIREPDAARERGPVAGEGKT